MTLQEICVERREKLGVTYQSIADQSNLPLSTVKKYFSADSKAPAITTAGPICKVLGVSLDEYFGITDRLTMSEELLNAKNDTLKAHEKELEKHLASNDKTIHIMWKGVKNQKPHHRRPAGAPVPGHCVRPVSGFQLRADRLLA